MTRFNQIKSTGATEKDLWKLGFRGIKTYDPEEDENYYKLFLNGKEVGFTEINEENGDIEIICESKVNYDKVIEIVGEKVTVWAWYNNVCTNLN